jgi:hypothetical protein
MGTAVSVISPIVLNERAQHQDDSLSLASWQDVDTAQTEMRFRLLASKPVRLLSVHFQLWQKSATDAV